MGSKTDQKPCAVQNHVNLPNPYIARAKEARAKGEVRQGACTSGGEGRAVEGKMGKDAGKVETERLDIRGRAKTKYIEQR